MKKTSVTPSATLLAMPRPNQTEKIGARITRGMLLSALMYGSAMRPASGDSASHSPNASPSAVPIANASKRLEQGDPRGAGRCRRR